MNLLTVFSRSLPFDALVQETVQVIARVGFKMFLNVNANVTAMNVEGTECR